VVGLDMVVALLVGVAVAAAGDAVGVLLGGTEVSVGDIGVPVGGIGVPVGDIGRVVAVEVGMRPAGCTITSPDRLVPWT